MNFAKTTILALCIGAASFMFVTKQIAAGSNVFTQIDEEFEKDKDIDAFEKDLQALEEENGKIKTPEQRMKQPWQRQRSKTTPILKSGYTYDPTHQQGKTQMPESRINRIQRDSGFNIPTTMDND